MPRSKKELPFGYIPNGPLDIEAERAACENIEQIIHLLDQPSIDITSIEIVIDGRSVKLRPNDCDDEDLRVALAAHLKMERYAQEEKAQKKFKEWFGCS